MPAIIGANQTIYDYNFALNKTVSMSFTQHVSRQTCHAWLTASLTSYLPSAALVAKAGLDVIGRFKSLSWLKPRENIIGHTLPLVGRPLNFAWNRPLTSGLMLLAAATLNVVSNFFVCMGENLYTMRAFVSGVGGEKLLDRIDTLLVQDEIFDKIRSDFNRTDGILAQKLKNWSKREHTLAHVDPRWLSEGYELVIKDPSLATIMESSNPKSEVEDLNKLIRGHLESLYLEKHPEHTEL